VTALLVMARSLVFNVLFYVTTTLFVVIGSPLLFAPRSWSMAALKLHARFELFLLRAIVGTKMYDGKSRHFSLATRRQATFSKIRLSVPTFPRLVRFSPRSPENRLLPANL